MKPFSFKLPCSLATIVSCIAFTLFTACKKTNDAESVTIPDNNFIKQVSRINPFSLANINKARERLNKHDAGNSYTQAREVFVPQRMYTYLKFDPVALTGDMLKIIEADTTVHVMNFPFANGELYNDSFALNEHKAAQLADGKLYAVVQKSSAIESILKRNAGILGTQVLDELYLPEETDTTLQFQAFREAGYTEEMIANVRICLFRQPSGFVRYLDTETNRLTNVPGIKVWALAFGIPIHTYTNRDGFYSFRWRFNAGTIIGTQAENRRVTIKPLNTMVSPWVWAATIPTHFALGARHTEGWFNACRMRNNINIEFTRHTESRFWAQIMHGIDHHDQFTTADGIPNAPDKLLVYANWANGDGGSSAPMLGHMSTLNIGSLLSQYFGGLLTGTDINNMPNIFNILHKTLPDITIRTNGNEERQAYSSRLMQTIFHELGHGSHFRRVGQVYWSDLFRATLRNHPEDECGGGYGCGQNYGDGNISIAESWAEFISTSHALRLHPNGQKESRWLGQQVTGTWRGLLMRFNDALEEEQWFFNDWVVSGFYHDLMDLVNSDPAEDNWDAIGGLTIQQLYEALGPNIDSFCGYQNEIMTRYNWLTIQDIERIFFRNGAGGCL